MSFESHHEPLKQRLFLYPLYRWGNWDPGKLLPGQGQSELKSYAPNHTHDSPQGFSLVWSGNGTTPSIWGNGKKMVGGEMTTEWRTSWAGDAVDYSVVTNSQEGSSRGILLGLLIKEVSAYREQVVWVMGIKEPTKQESEGQTRVQQGTRCVL